MFETDNDPWENPKAKKKTTGTGFDRKLLFGGLAILTLAVCLIVGLVAYISLGGRDAKPDVGLKNPNSISDPDPVTAGDLEQEYQDRPTLDKETPEVWEKAITRLLNLGDFAELDSYLQEEMVKYKNVEGDEGQAVEDWREKFDMLRSDVARAANLTKDQSPEVTLTQYCDPQILAATLVWSPVSVKMDAFADYSSLILPNPTEGDIDLRAVDPAEASKMLQEVNEISPVRYIDLAAYDAVVFGYDIRIVLVADQQGYYRPWTVIALDDDINREVWCKPALQQIRMSLDPYSDLDSTLPDLPPKAEVDINTEPMQGENVPDGSQTQEGNIPDGASSRSVSQEEATPAGSAVN